MYFKILLLRVLIQLMQIIIKDSIMLQIECQEFQGYFNFFEATQLCNANFY